MSRNFKIAIYLIIIGCASVYKQVNILSGNNGLQEMELKEMELKEVELKEIEVEKMDLEEMGLEESIGEMERIMDKYEELDISQIELKVNSPSSSSSSANYTRPKEGFSPYDEYFGRGIYDKSVMNEFVIKNSFSTDAVVLLINAYTGRKVRNEYIRKGSNFSMTSVPNGTYYMEWTSGEDWNPNLDLGQVTGGFETNSSYTKTRERDDWMQVTGYDRWTVTLYKSTSGDVESETLSSNEFGK